MLVLLLDFPEQVLQALKFLHLHSQFLLVAGPNLLYLFLQLVLLSDLHEYFIPHGFQVRLQEFRLGLVRVPGVMVVVYLIIGRLVLLRRGVAVLSKGLILERIKGGVSLPGGVS